MVFGKQTKFAQMNSRELILNSITLRKPTLSLLPEVPLFERNDVDLVAHFKEMLQLAGGHAIEWAEDFDLMACIFDIYPDAKTIWSNVGDVKSLRIKPESITDSHLLQDVDMAIIKGEIGVAENAAIWIGRSSISHRVLPFITQHLVVLLDKTKLVWNMHQAYQQPELTNLDGFGVFISGPSKTADIEQSLVIGAHGSRSLTVFLV